MHTQKNQSGTNPSADINTTDGIDHRSFLPIGSKTNDNFSAPSESWLNDTPPLNCYDDMPLPDYRGDDAPYPADYDYQALPDLPVPPLSKKIKELTKQKEGVDSTPKPIDLIIAKAVERKKEQLGVDALSGLQTDLVTKTILANYEPKNREWLKAPTIHYLDLLETQEYKEAYSAILGGISNGTMTAEINHRYALASHVAAYDLGIEVLVSKQDMKTGKSYAHGWMIANHPAIRKNTGTPTSKSICHLESINVSNAKKRNDDAIEHGWGVVHASYKADSFADVDNVLTSINSEKSNKIKAQIISLDLLLMDESEGMGSFLVSDSLPNKWSSIESMRQTIKDTDFVIFTDAHVGGVTDRFIGLLTDRPVFRVVNNAKVWSDVTGYVIDGRDKGIKQNINQLRVAIKLGKAVGSFFANANDAKIAHRKICNELGLTDDQYPLITSQTSKNKFVQKLKSNPDLFDNLVGFCASSTIGIGISIESYKFLTAFLYASDSDNVGDSMSQVQMPFRLRQIKVLVLVNCKTDRDITGLADELADLTAKKALADELLVLTLNADDQIKALVAKMRLSAQRDVYSYSADMRAFYIEDCLIKLDKIEAELTSKGIKLIPLDIKISDYEEKEAIIISDQLKVEALARRVHTPIITPDEAKEIVAKKRKDNNSISELDEDKLIVYTVAKNLLSDDYLSAFAKVPPEAIKAYLNNGVLSKRDNLQRAIAPKRHIKKIAKAHAYGVKDGRTTRLQRDLGSWSAETMIVDCEYDRYLISLIDVRQDDNGYVSSIDGTINLDNAHGRTKNKVIKKINQLIDKRNALKTTGKLEGKVTDKNISKQIKSKISGRMGIAFKARAKTPAVSVERLATPPSYLLPVLGAVFGTKKRRIYPKQVTADDVRQTNMIDLLMVDDVLDIINDSQKYKINATNTEKQPLRTLKRLLDVAGISYSKTSVSNGYRVATKDYDAQYLAGIAKEKGHNKIAEELAYIESIGATKN